MNSNNNTIAQQQQQQPQNVDYPHADSFGFQIDDDAYGLDFQANRDAASVPPEPNVDEFALWDRVRNAAGGGRLVANPERAEDNVRGQSWRTTRALETLVAMGLPVRRGKNMFWWG